MPIFFYTPPVPIPPRRFFSFDTSGAWHAVRFIFVTATIFMSGIFAARQSETFVADEAIKRVARSSVIPTPQKPPSPSITESSILSTINQPAFLTKEEVARKRDELLEQQDDFIFADLDDMMVTHYASGTVRARYVIAAKADEGSFFEVPAGLYEVTAKFVEYVPRIERVRMPYALRLFGNYVIHAKPLHQKITAPLSSSASIALSYHDGRELFSQATQHTPVLVSRAHASSTPQLSYFKKTRLPHEVPVVSAAGAIAIDLETGAILFQKNSKDIYPTASVAKLMTAVITEEYISSSTIIAAGEDSISAYGNTGGMVKGESFLARDLLYGLLLPSSNDAARMLELAHPDFIALMNDKAQKLGMAHTNFADASGLNQNTVSNVSDLAALLKYILISHPHIALVSRTRTYAAVSSGRKLRHIWDNVNWPAGDARYLGGKAGFTDESLQTMAGAYALNPSGTGPRPIALVVLGSRNRITDIRSIARYIEDQFIYGAILTHNSEKPSAAFSGASIFEAVR